MNASIFLLATVLATQSGNQLLVSGTITNNTDVFTGMQYTIIYPKGNGSALGPVTFYYVDTCAGNYSIADPKVFVVDITLPNVQASTTPLDNNKNFNWASNTYNKPNGSIVVKGTIRVYQDSPPVTKYQTSEDKYVP